MKDSYKHTGTLKEEDIIKFTIKGSDGKEYFYYLDKKRFEEEKKLITGFERKDDYV